MISVIIIEDNKIIRESIATLITGTEGLSCIGAYVDCESLLKESKLKDTDVILMDIALPGMSGIEGVKIIKEKFPEINVLMLTVYEDSKQIFDALCAGACGYMIKKTPPAKLLDAIKDAYEGGSPMSSVIARKVVTVFQKIKPHKTDSTSSVLSEREKEVLNNLSWGKSYQETAEALFISVDTVRHHIRNIYIKLHVHSQSEAVAKAIRRGII